MHELLLRQIFSGIRLTEHQVRLIEGSFVPRQMKKGQFYQRAGEVTTHGGFVVEGCFRTYVTDEKGRENILHFSPEGAWIGDIQSATTGMPTPFFVDVIEDARVLIISLQSFDALIAAIPEFGHRYRLGLEGSEAAKQRRLALLLHASGEERYLEFVKRHPALAERVPQYMLASYLGLTPETLSRIRARITNENQAS